MPDNAKHQAAYRDRRKAERERMMDALSSIIARLEGNDKPLAVELRGMARAGLGITGVDGKTNTTEE